MDKVALAAGDQAKQMIGLVALTAGLGERLDKRPRLIEIPLPERQQRTGESGRAQLLGL